MNIIDSDTLKCTEITKHRAELKEIPAFLERMETEEMKTVEKEWRESPENMHFPDIKIKEFKGEKSLNGAKRS